MVMWADDSDYPLWVGIGQNTAFAAKQRFAPWAYGLPKKVSVLNASNVKISETVNTYSFSTVYPTEAHCGSLTAEQQMHYNRTLLLKRPIGVLSAKCVVRQYTSQRNTDWSNPAIYDDPASYRTSSTSNMTIDIYDFYTGRAELDKTEEKVFKPGDVNSFLLTTTQYIYNDQNYEISSVKKSKSDGTISRKNIYYSIDYVKPYGLCYLPRNDVSTTNAEMIALVNQNVISQVVETSAMENDKFIKDEATIFTTLANGDIKPFKTLTTRLTQPEPSYNLPQAWFDDYYNPANNVPAALFNPASPNYTLYTVTQTLSYDNSGNLIGIKDEGNRNIANIYDYSGKHIIGSVVNADPIVDKPAYSSFETGELGGWQLTGGSPVYVTNGITGARAFNLTGRTLTATLNTSKPYIVSFWATGSGVTVTGGATLVKSAPAYNGFTYYEYNIASGTSAVFVSGSSTIDELRLFPKNALMNTTTYDPLIGKTAESDANNRITYYEYDNLGRLRFIKDEAKNIVKMYEYNNVSEAKQRGCPGTYYNYAISELFTSGNCGPGYIGGVVTYTVPANMFSSAISQADADAQAEYYLMTNGQAFANTAPNQVCIQLYYNTEQSQTFYSQDCPPGYIGGAVSYTVPANTYSSTISVADANQRALEEIAANGQYSANLPGNAICQPSTEPYWSWQEGDAKYCSSFNGQPPHLMLLTTDLNPNSPSYGQTQWKDAGPSDDCPAGTYYNAPRNVVFYKNDCSPGIGLPVTFSVAEGVYSSTVSQAAADQLATDYINANGQAWANANGSCCTPSFTFASGISVVTNYLTLTGSSTMNFTWVFGHTGSTSLLLGTINPACARPTTQRTIPKYSGSTLYNIIIYPNGNVVLQWISGPLPPTGTMGITGGFDLLANAYYSVQKSGTFTRNNCPSGQIAGSATYTVQQYAYSSLVDQATADQLAQNDVNANGQAYANGNATCTPAATSCSFSASSSISWYSSTMSLTSTTVSITFAFSSPSGGYIGGTLGYLPVGTCRPSVNRTFSVTDGANSSRIWSVTIATGGFVSISLASGPSVASGDMITLSGTYSL